MCKLQKWKVDDINSFFDNKIEFIDISNDEWYNDAVANNIMETPTLLFKDWGKKHLMSHNIDVDLAKEIITNWIKWVN